MSVPVCCLQVTYQQQQELLKAQQQAAEADARMAEQMDLVMQVSGQARGVWWQLQ